MLLGREVARHAAGPVLIPQLTTCASQQLTTAVLPPQLTTSRSDPVLTPQLTTSRSEPVLDPQLTSSAPGGAMPGAGNDPNLRSKRNQQLRRRCCSQLLLEIRNNLHNKIFFDALRGSLRFEIRNSLVLLRNNFFVLCEGLPKFFHILALFQRFLAGAMLGRGPLQFFNTTFLEEFEYFLNVLPG